MIRDVEKMLCEAPRSNVPESLDCEVEDLIRRAELDLPAPKRRRVPIWAAVAACAVSSLMGFAARSVLWPPGEAAAPPPASVYIEEIQENLPGLLGGGGDRVETRFFERSYREVEFIPRGSEWRKQ